MNVAHPEARPTLAPLFASAAAALVLVGMGTLIPGSIVYFVLLAAFVIAVGLRLGGVPYGIILACAVIISHLFLGDLDIGPFSSRIYLIVLLAGMGGLRMLFLREAVFRTRRARLLGATYALFIFIAVVNKAINGVSPDNIAYGIASTHLFALLLFILLQQYLRRESEMVLFARVLGGTALVSAGVAILQWLGVDWLWQLSEQLHPVEKLGEVALLRASIIGRAVPGLAAYSIPLGYHLITFGMFALAWFWFAVQEGRLAQKAFVGALAVGTLALGILVTQSRSAVLATILASAFIWLMTSSAKERGEGVGRRLKRSLVPLTVLASIVVGYIAFEAFASSSQSYGEGRYTLGHLLETEDPLRSIFASAAFELFSRSILLGAGLEDFSEVVEAKGYVTAVGGLRAPHNMFLSAVVYYALPGLAVLLLLLIESYHACVRGLQGAMCQVTLKWVGMGCVLGFAAYIINAQFHNDSFVTGGVLPWCLLALLCSIEGLGEAHE